MAGVSASRLDFERPLGCGALPFVGPVVGVPGRLEAGVEAFDEAVPFFFCAAVLLRRVRSIDDEYQCISTVLVIHTFG